MVGTRNLDAMLGALLGVLLLASTSAHAKDTAFALYLDFDELVASDEANWGPTVERWTVFDRSGRYATDVLSAHPGYVSLLPDPHGQALAVMEWVGIGFKWPGVAFPADGLSILTWIQVVGSAGLVHVEGADDDDGPVFSATSAAHAPDAGIGLTACRFNVWDRAADFAYRTEAGDTPAGRWVHMAAVYNPGAGEAAVYVDGNRADTPPSDGVSGRVDGRRYDGGVQIWMYGSVPGDTVIINDLAVWTRGLSQEEIRPIMENGIQLPVPPQGRATTIWGELKGQ